ncbi:MAG: hypothetical protein IKI04_02165 [Bacilli bacterium]|nr:hypothetical protein [Bacilli bacterium]
MIKDKYRITVWEDLLNSDGGGSSTAEQFYSKEVGTGNSSIKPNPFLSYFAQDENLPSHNFSLGWLLSEKRDIRGITGPFELRAYQDLNKTSFYTLHFGELSYSNGTYTFSSGSVNRGLVDESIGTLTFNVGASTVDGFVTPNYREQLIATIGSDTMESPARAVEPKLVENINGTNTFTFKMYYTYFDFELKK